MSGSDSLLVELRRRGLTLTARNGQLLVGPAGLLSPELRASIRAHRAELIALLAAESAPVVESYPSTTQPPRIAQRANLGPSRAFCGACSHFLPDYINPSEGLGRCGVTGTGPPAGGNGYGACFPMAPRQCPAYQPRNER